jgi:hypothetical protein
VGPCLGAHDQSSALAHDTGNRSGTVAAYEGTGTRLGAIHQPDLPSDRHAFRRALSLVCHRGGQLSARLPTLHRAEPGSRAHGTSPGRLSLVELPLQRFGFSKGAFARRTARRYRCNALGVGDPVVVPHSIYCALAEGEEARRARYLNLFADEIPEGDLTAIRDATNGAFALGSERFQRQIASMVGRRTWPGKSGRPRKEAPDDDQLKLPI